jgi:hypothetical protein
MKFARVPTQKDDQVGNNKIKQVKESGRTDGRMDGRIDGWMDGWMDGWIDR